MSEIPVSELKPPREGNPRIGEVVIPEKGSPFQPWFCHKPTVKILFYTDDTRVGLNYQEPFGVGRLRDLITNHNIFFANFEIDVLNRHANGHAANRLTKETLSRYDQVWFFGIRQANRPQSPYHEPYNELTDTEVAELRTWMRTGGVLITGDHSNPWPLPPEPPTTLLNLGRALGHRVPRASELRRWEGLPDSSIAGSYNTQTPDGVHNLNDLTLQDDAFPQHVILKRYPLWSFLPWVQRSRPHPLFCGRRGPITVFPDHMHEGRLVIPAAFPAGVWPSGPWGQPRPEVIARGIDKRNGNVYGLVTAYDGSTASVGRIVADSTWHHYFNINLMGFPPGPVLDDIAEFYVNLCVWLSPPAKRWAMRCWIWWWLFHHSTVQMELGNPIEILGSTGYNVLGQVASQCAITEFVWPFPLVPELYEQYAWPPEELIVGGILQQYHEAFEAVRAGRKAPAPDELVAQGVRVAHETHTAQVTDMLTATEKLAHIMEEGLQLAAVENKITI